MVVLLSGLRGINRDLYEAASVDGASARDRFRSITLPLMMPVALTVILLGLIYTFEVLDLIDVMTGGDPVDATSMPPIQAYQFVNVSTGAATDSVIPLLPPFVAAFSLWWTRREETTL